MILLLFGAVLLYAVIRISIDAARDPKTTIVAGAVIYGFFYCLVHWTDATMIALNGLLVGSILLLLWDAFFPDKK